MYGRVHNNLPTHQGQLCWISGIFSHYYFLDKLSLFGRKGTVSDIIAGDFNRILYEVFITAAMQVTPAAYFCVKKRGLFMFQTKITELLGIKYPIIGGTLMWISTSEFTAAISNAGGLGVLCSAMYDTRDAFAEAIDRVNDLTERPFAVNINLFPMMRPIDNNEYVDVLVEKGVKIVETSGHSAPEDLCQRFKEAGMIWIH